MLSLVLAVALVIPTTAYAAEEKHIEIWDEEVFLYVGDQRPFDYQILPEGVVPDPDDMDLTWKSGDENVLEHMHDNFFEAVAAGTTTVTVTTKSGLTDTIPVTVMAPLKWNGEKTESIIFNTRFQERMFEITVPEDGLYQFTGEKVDDYVAEFDLFEGNDYSNNPKTSFESYNGVDSQVYLEASKTYTLRGWSYGGSFAYDLTLSKAVEEDDDSVEVDGLFRQDSVTISVGEMLYLPSFIQTGEIVSFLSGDENIVTLGITAGNDVASALSTGDVVITAVAQGNEQDTLKITVVEPESFDMNATKKVSLGDGFLNKVYKITLEQNDNRYLMSYAGEDNDTYARILDASGNVVADCDDFKGLDFGFDFADLYLYNHITYDNDPVGSLAAGTYYLLITEYGFRNENYYDFDAFDVEVIQGESVAADTVELYMHSPSDMLISDDIYHVRADMKLYFDVKFGSSIMSRDEGWDVKSNNTDVVCFDDNSGMWFTKNTGTATVTVETENGLTDSVKICVLDKFIAGDLNLDGVIGSADINLILGVINGTVEMKDIYYQAEVNGDNKIDVDDIAALVKSAELIKNPTKTTYTVGESFDTTGMELKVTFVDGNVETVTDGFIVSGYDATKEGTQKVTISYGNETFPFEVTVVKVSPATGDATTYTWAIVMILCAGYAVLTLKKRRNG